MDQQKRDEDFQAWMNKTWRPLMAYTYIVICIFDFIIAPIGWSIVQSMQGTMLTQPWPPITLQGAGLFHAAMGAILGVTAWGRSKEKLARMDGDYYDSSPTSMPYRSTNMDMNSPAPVRYQPRGR